ncbi:hypothetical protein [Francisella marina]|uniref:DUF1640 domain-containing protein n=1 Tax=Francisella marina TaxID=2249302 RepID=A0ABX5ZGK8_9GAMM|nr:hypothetical protein [Francisella marina]QEO57575.1 hypothetical protein F0R74_06805 [Francisella marina]
MEDKWLGVITDLASKVGSLTETDRALTYEIRNGFRDTNERFTKLESKVLNIDERLKAQEEIEKNRDVVKEHKKKFWQGIDKKTKDMLMIIPAVIAIIGSAISLFFNH